MKICLFAVSPNTQGSVPAAVGVDRSPVERERRKTSAGFRAACPQKPGRKLEEGQSLKEILAKIARAMPSSPDQDLINAWNALQARKAFVRHTPL